jgi:cell division protein FtsN
VIVVAIGGAGAMYLRSFDRSASGPPPVIAAPDGPVKIEPVEAQDGGEETVGDAVYDRVAGQNTGAQEGTEENVVEGAEEPQEIARIVVPPAESGNGETLVEPGGEAAVAGAGESEPVAAEAQGGEEEFGPRRVPTYVVRPDGTIVATAEAESHAGEPDLAGQQMATAQTEAMEPKPVETVIIDEPRVAGSPGSTTMAVESEPPARTDDVMDEAPAIVEESTEAAPEEGATELAELRPSEEPAVSEPSPAPAEQPTQAAASEPEPTETPVPPTATSGYLVQLSATGSPEEAEATYDRLQSRHASILGNLDPNIQRADLGERGVFYRVRVGPWQQRDEAIGVCDALKAAGADCYVTQ